MNEGMFEGIELFSGCREARLDLEKAEVQDYAPGEVIVGQGAAFGKIGIIMEGSAEVYKQSMLMRVLHQNSIIGAATMFTDKKSATCVLTSKGCRVAFFAQEVFTEMLRRDFVLVKNYIRYLTERIHFLTDRIESVSMPTIEEKVMNYLIKNAHGGRFVPEYGMGKLAEALAVSRASLYRVLDKLEAEHQIKRMKEEIIITADCKEEG